MDMDRKIKYWIRILFCVFAFGLANKFWTVLDYHGVSEDWTYVPDRRYKIKEQIIVNTSPDTGVWVQSRYHHGGNRAEFGLSDVLFLALVGLPITMIFYHSRAWEKNPRA